MTDQIWTIVSKIDGAVLAPAFTTGGVDQHPESAGWDFDEALQLCIPVPDRPDLSRHEWNGTAWVMNLTAAKARAWAAVKAARDRAEWSGCMTAMGRVDTDPDSQRKVSGSVQMAMIAAQAGAPFLLDWTMQDNSTVTHDAPAMIGMGVAVGQHVAACHSTAVGRRNAIMAATTVEDIEAIEADSGWPGAA